MVADAVRYEPVSTLKFPANREKNREFRRIRPLSAILKADTRANSKACSEIPYATEQGIIRRNREFWRRNREFLPAENRNRRRMRFSVHTGQPDAVAEGRFGCQEPISPNVLV